MAYRPPVNRTMPAGMASQMQGMVNQPGMQATGLGNQSAQSPFAPGGIYSNAPAPQQPGGQQMGPQQGGGTMYAGGSQGFYDNPANQGQNWQQPGGGQPAPYPQQPQPGYQYGSGPNPGMQAPPTGLIGAEQALQGGLAGSMIGLQEGMQQGRGDINSQLSFGRRGLDPFMQRGQQSGGLQAALSGAMGPQAQQQAYQNFQDSPGQAWLQEKGERAVTRNASAMGGLGGGRVMQELQRQGQGLAAQDFQNAYGRLNDMTGQGLQAAGMSGQLAGQGAGLLGNLGMQGGIAAGGYAQQAGRDLAQGRTQAGRDIAGNVAGSSTALSNLVNQQGIGLSGLLGQTGGDLATLLSGAGQQHGTDANNLATLLATISQNQATQNSGLPALPGTQQTEGAISKIGDLLSGAGNFMTGMG